MTGGWGVDQQWLPGALVFTGEPGETRGAGVARANGSLNRGVAPCQSRHRAVVRRVATVSVHTSPLDQPGTGDAGGLNVYIVEEARPLSPARAGSGTFTPATARSLP